MQKLRFSIVLLGALLLTMIAIDVSAQVGIGNTNPLHQLDITGPMRLREVPVVSGTTPFDFVVLGTDPNGTSGPASNTFMLWRPGANQENVVPTWNGTAWEFKPGSVPNFNPPFVVGPDGTVGLPDGSEPGDIIRWNGTTWEVSNNYRVCTTSSNVLTINNETMEVCLATPPPGSTGTQTIIWNSATNQWEFGQGSGNFTCTSNSREIEVTDTPASGATPRALTITWTGPQFPNPPARREDTCFVYRNGVWGAGPCPESTPNRASWNVIGNKGLNSSVNFIGTTDAVDFIIKTNDVTRAWVDRNGAVRVNEGATSNVAVAFQSTAFASAGANDPRTAILGKATGIGGVGVTGEGNFVGVNGYASSADGENAYGIKGETESKGAGSAGIKAVAYSEEGQTFGIDGETFSGENGSAGIRGYASNSTSSGAGNGGTFGVIGQSDGNGDAIGVNGLVTNGEASAGVRGLNISAKNQNAGVYGVISINQNSCGNVLYGVRGEIVTPAGTPILDGPLYGVFGRVPTSGATQGCQQPSFAIFSEGAFAATGSKNFIMDHPLDPANKTLTHGVVESPYSTNMYSGNVTTGANGEAVVTLPDYFSEINKDYRYQLTCIGQFANAIVLKKIENNKFVVKTDKPNVEVSWVVYGTRNDRWMRANPEQPERNKGAMAGKYLTPTLYNQPESKSYFYRPLTNTDIKAKPSPNNRRNRNVNRPLPNPKQSR